MTIEKVDEFPDLSVLDQLDDFDLHLPKNSVYVRKMDDRDVDRQFYGEDFYISFHDDGGHMYSDVKKADLINALEEDGFYVHEVH